MNNTEAISHATQGDDSEALSLVLNEFLPYWLRAAHSILGGTGSGDTDASDLVQEAVLKLIELWRRGEGPKTNTRAYVTSIMRNAHINRLRSPRSKERPIEDFESGQEFQQVDDYGGVETALEADAVRRAFAELTEDHRRVLQAVLIEGQKPASLVQELNRPAPAISSLLARAKQALHRSLLVDYLARGSSECAENARKLPNRVHDEPQSHAGKDRGLAHVLRCDGCQRNWRRFASVSTAFGVLPLFTVVQLVRDESIASAAQAMSSADMLVPEAVETAPSYDGTGSWNSSDMIGSDPASVANNGSSNSSNSSSAGGSAGTSGAVGSTAGAAPAAGGGVVGSAAATGTAAASSLGTAVAAALGSNLVLAASIALVVAGSGVIAVNHFWGPKNSTVVSADSSKSNRVESIPLGDGEHAATISLPENPYGADLDVRFGLDSEGTLHSITSDFSVRNATTWQLTALDINLSPGTTITASPSGLNCEVSGNAAACTASPDSPTSSASGLVFTVNDHSPRGQGTFSLELTAQADGEVLVGSASGKW